MDIVFVCNTASGSSILTNLVLAAHAKEQGADVGILFTQDALAAVCGRTFEWPLLLRGRQEQMTIARNAKEAAIPVVSERDSRQTDIPALLRATRAKGVRLLACPIWSKLLAPLQLPPELEPLGQDVLLKLVEERKVAGLF